MPPLGLAARGSAILDENQWIQIGEALRLSAREAEILRSVFDDVTEAGMAEKLEISPHTVHSHLTRLYRKLGVRSRAECVVRVFAQYLIAQR